MNPPKESLSANLNNQIEETRHLDLKKILLVLFITAFVIYMLYPKKSFGGGITGSNAGLCIGVDLSKPANSSLAPTTINLLSAIPVYKTKSKRVLAQPSIKFGEMSDGGTEHRCIGILL